MKRILSTVLLVGLFCQSALSQSINATFSPKERFKFALIYKMNETGEDYIANGKVKNGIMNLKLPSDMKEGIYRLVYKLPKEKYYFDFAYSKKDINFNFDGKKGNITFDENDINQFYYQFARKNNKSGKTLASLIRKGNDRALKSQLTIVKKEQEMAMEKAKGTLVEELVKNRLIPLPSFDPDRKKMWANYKQNFLNNIDFNSTNIKSSKLLYDKSVTFVRLGFERRGTPSNRKELNANIDALVKKIDHWNPALKKHFLKLVWTKISRRTTEKNAIYLAQTHLLPIAKQEQDKGLVTELNAYVNLAIGNQAPEIEWDENEQKQYLSQQNGFDHYVLVFWSSGCSHCQKQMPELQTYLKGDQKTKVIAVGMENHDHRWKKFITKLPDFTHALAPGKWKNPLVETYNLKATPTYFILDRNKKIAAKPTGFNSFKKLYSQLKQKNKS